VRDAKNVSLRPVELKDLDLFDAEFASADGAGEFQWFGYTSFAAVRRRFEENGLLGPDGGMLSVACDGTTVGRVEWFPSVWGRPATSTCWTIAIGLVADHRGKGIGTRAQAALVDYLFANTRAVRVQAFTDVENIAERRALEKAGFEFEGCLRKAQWRAGRWHDQALYSTVRDTV
jgi:RimJ/RimL family protein N-acetyltransferase